MLKLEIQAEVLCPSINAYSKLDQCVECIHFGGLDEGTHVVCNYDE